MLYIRILSIHRLCLALMLLLGVTGTAAVMAQAADTTAADPLSGLEAEYQHIVATRHRLDTFGNPGEKLNMGSDMVADFVIDQRVGLLRSELDFIQHCIEKAPPEHSCLAQSQTLVAGYPAAVSQTYGEKHVQLPAADLAIAERVLAYARIFDVLEVRDAQDDLFLRALQLTQQLGADSQPLREQLSSHLQTRAINTTIVLSQTLHNVRALKEASDLLAGDADLKARLTANEGLARRLGQALERQSKLLKQLGVDTADYDQLVVKATGQLSATTLSTGLVAELFSSWGNKVSDLVVDEGPGLILNLLVVLVILVVFWRLGRLAEKVVFQALNRSRKRGSQLLHKMVVNLVGNAVFVVGILIALSQIGISLGPLLAGVGVVGFVIGFALQDTLSNFASGVMILVYSPFDVDDVIETGGVFGKVNHMSLVNTTILTFDNQTVVVPNNKIWGEVIKNLTNQKQRRVDMTFGIGYGADIDLATEILENILEEDERILDHPEPLVRLHELGDSSVNFVVRPWVKPDDYWEVYWHTTREVKKRFDAQGIEIPFPQRDVHLDTSSPLRIQLDGNGGGSSAAPVKE